MTTPDLRAAAQAAANAYNDRFFVEGRGLVGPIDDEMRDVFAAIDASLAAPSAVAAEDARRNRAARLRQLAEAFSECIPALVNHHEWRGWPGSIRFAEVALDLLAAPHPAPAVAAEAGQGEPNSLLEWACYRWRDEVQGRPLVNVHRRTLDDTWRQVVRFAGGDPDELLGPSHDDMLSGSKP